MGVAGDLEKISFGKVADRKLSGVGSRKENREPAEWEYSMALEPFLALTLNGKMANLKKGQHIGSNAGAELIWKTLYGGADQTKVWWISQQPPK